MISAAVSEARDALRRGDLDAALDQLIAASERRQAARGDDPIVADVDQILEEVSERLHPGAPGREEADAVSLSSRGPGMWAMTAANRVRETIEEADRSGRTPDLTDGDIEALDRVDIDEAGAARADWQHRRPERVSGNPLTSPSMSADPPARAADSAESHPKEVASTPDRVTTTARRRDLVLRSDPRNQDRGRRRVTRWTRAMPEGVASARLSPASAYLGEPLALPGQVHIGCSEVVMGVVE